MNSTNLDLYVERGELGHVDARFAELMMRLGRVANPALALLFARVSRALAQQHSCLNLAASPDDRTLVDELRQLPIVSTDGAGTPLVLDGENLYLQRYYLYETRIADYLRRMNKAAEHPNADTCASILGTLFAAPGTSLQQRLAVLQAMCRKLTIITGGPGTGKTTTVVRIIDALTRLAGDTPLAIKLAAPTGKAAMRMKEALSRSTLAVAPDVLTLHRLLGVRGNGRDYRYSEHNRLPVDLLIVDEVSMIDLAMMHRLLAALPEDARLVLLGDPDQLPSVEAGNILADICKYPVGYSGPFVDFVRAATGDAPAETGNPPHHLTNAVCRLQQSYRFSPDRGIGKLSITIRSSGFVIPRDDDEVTMRPLAAFTTATAVACYDEYLALIATETNPAALLDAFDRVRILAPGREGERGVEGINRDIESTLAEQGAIDADQPFYHGRPILVTRNDYNLRLFNGDAGICIHKPGEEPTVAFRDASGELRVFLASRLPPHESCFAMTVHKSQGSEFEQVVLVLPEPPSDAARQIMTREMVYTAVTRARQHVTLYFDGDTLNTCLTRRSARHSGLGERLLGAD